MKERKVKTKLMNYYNNYPYNYSFGVNPYLQQQPSYSYQQASAAPNSTNILNGKIVDSEDMVKATEVPIGGFGIFPKADLSEIYIKSWNNNGTTNLITFKPYIPPAAEQNNNSNSLVDFTIVNEILEKVSALEGKIDTILNIKSNAPVSIAQQKEGLKANGY